MRPRHEATASPVLVTAVAGLLFHDARAGARRRRARVPMLSRGVAAFSILILAAMPGLGRAPASPGWLAPAGPAAQWRSEDPSLSGLFTMVVGTDVTQVFALADLGALPPLPRGSVVMYDLEPGHSPADEVDDPVASMSAFVARAHALGYRAMLAPSRWIGMTDRHCPSEVPRDAGVESRFVGCGIPAVPADYFLLQAQRLECQPSRYASFVRAVSAQVHSRLIAELTVGWTAPCVNLDVVRAAWSSTQGLGIGYALWGSRLDAAPFLRQVLSAR